MGPTKDEEYQQPIPEEWREVFKAVAKRFVDQDYLLLAAVPSVSPVSEEIATQIRDYVQGYGEKLIPLQEGTWERSVAMWMGNSWDVVVDLCTESEGVSDLVLHAKVRECEHGYAYEISGVWVP